ncbi:hypothetical protein HNR37_001338 [Desulfurispira natronophila]|uniref:Uncharacterized protein n=1 Tax=Desulfurispira natronophila TaxID=682562 RepID=A0A7W8DGY7_9BACT|nr:hypothetical protein [Desulfurispira natronophila]
MATGVKGKSLGSSKCWFSAQGPSAKCPFAPVVQNKLSSVINISHGHMEFY